DRAVFFIGAAMSIGSERNSAGRLITRLLIRLRSFVTIARLHPGKPIRAAAEQTLIDFKCVFGAPLDASGKKDPEIILTELWLGAIEKKDNETSKWIGIHLAEKYYELNDWFCSAFAIFLRHLQV